MEPNVDRGMWAVVMLLAAIVIGGVVLLAFPRISGKIAQGADKAVEDTLRGDEPDWIKDQKENGNNPDLPDIPEKPSENNKDKEVISIVSDFSQYTTNFYNEFKDEDFEQGTLSEGSSPKGVTHQQSKTPTTLEQYNNRARLKNDVKVSEGTKIYTDGYKEIFYLYFMDGKYTKDFSSSWDTHTKANPLTIKRENFSEKGDVMSAGLITRNSDLSMNGIPNGMTIMMEGNVIHTKGNDKDVFNTVSSASKMTLVSGKFENDKYSDYELSFDIGTKHEGLMMIITSGSERIEVPIDGTQKSGTLNINPKDDNIKIEFMNNDNFKNINVSINHFKLMAVPK